MPFTSLSWKIMNRISMGSTDRTRTVKIRGISRECSPLNWPSAKGRVLLEGLWIRVLAKANSFHIETPL